MKNTFFMVANFIFAVANTIFYGLYGEALYMLAAIVCWIAFNVALMRRFYGKSSLENKKD